METPGASGGKMIQSLPAEPGPFKVEVLIPYGKFRGPDETCQIRAQNDLQAIAVWLAEFSDSPHTLASYRKEVERLLMWAMALPEPAALSGLTRENFILYDKFLADPQPVNQWVGSPLPRNNPNWKPFSWHHAKEIALGDHGEPIVKLVKKSGLSEASRRQAFDVLGSLYSYLHKVGYLLVNPLAAKTRRRRGGTAQRKNTMRYLDRDTWHFLIDFIDELPKETKRDQQHYHRVRWLFYLLYLTFARRAEIAAAKMIDFYRDGSDGLWYWHVLGKGTKEREIPVSEELLAEYISYRRFNRLPDAPGPNEDTPLVLSIAGNSQLTPKTVYLIVKGICFRAAQALKHIDPMKADKLEQATTHWMRHTSATHFVDDGGDLRVAQEKLGHGSITTTMIYQHSQKTDMHEKSSRLRVRKL